MDPATFYIVDPIIKIKRKLQWNSFFKNIENQSSSSNTSCMVKHLESLVLPPKNAANEGYNDHKYLSFCTATKIKRLNNCNIGKRNVRRQNSKSFCSKVRQKNNNVRSILNSNHIQYLMYNWLENSDAAEQNSVRDKILKYLATSQKEEVNLTCPTFGYQDYAKLVETSSCNNNDVQLEVDNISDRIQQCKSQRKSKIETTDILKKRNRNLNNSIDIYKMNVQEKSPKNVQVLKMFSRGKTGKVSDLNKVDVISAKVDREYSYKVHNKNQALNTPTGSCELILNAADIPPAINLNQTNKCNDIVNHTVAQAIHNTDRLKVCLRKRNQCLSKVDCSEKNRLFNFSSAESEKKSNVKHATENTHIFKVPKVAKSKHQKKMESKEITCETNQDCTNHNQLVKNNSVNKSVRKKSIETRNNKTKKFLESVSQAIRFKKTGSTSDFSDEEYPMNLSTDDRKYIASYLRDINATNRYMVMLQTVNLIEQLNPGMTKHILGMRILEKLGESDSEKYKSLMKDVKLEISKLSKLVQRNVFEDYKRYTLWLYERRRTS